MQRAAGSRGAPASACGLALDPSGSAGPFRGAAKHSGTGGGLPHPGRQEALLLGPPGSPSAQPSARSANLSRVNFEPCVWPVAAVEATHTS